MFQKIKFKTILFEILVRVLLVGIGIGIGIYFFPLTIHDFVVNTLGYQKPSGFFGFTLADWNVSWFVSATLWIGIIFGTFGKKIDYIFISIMFTVFSLSFLSTENMTLLVYSGLIGSTIIGNILGFILKLLRQRFFPKVDL